MEGMWETDTHQLQKKIGIQLCLLEIDFGASTLIVAFYNNVKISDLYRSSASINNVTSRPETG